MNAHSSSNTEMFWLPPAAVAKLLGMAVMVTSNAGKVMRSCVILASRFSRGLLSMMRRIIVKTRPTLCS